MGSEATNVKSFYKGQCIYKEGQAGSTAYLVQKGSVNLYRVRGNTKQLIVRLGKGDIFGEMGALAGTPRTESAEAAEYCDIMVLSKQLITNLLAQSPKTVRHLVQLLLRKVQAAERAAAGTKDHKNTFLSICRLLDMASTSHVRLPPAEARKDKTHELGLKRSEFSRACKDVLLVTQLEIDTVLEKLASLKIITLETRKMDKAFSEKFIAIADRNNFLEVAANLQKELRESGQDQCELEYIDIFDFAEAVEADPQIVYKKISQGEVPESLFFFSSQHTLDWARKMGTEFFQKVTRRRKRVEDLEDVDDVIFVDKSTLQDVLGSMGYYKIGILLALAGEEARAKLLSTLSKKIAAIVQEEAKTRESIDETEADDVQDELITMIKAAKGVAVS
ncbi:MAG: cyclic nucleotide-binding domain-containing protein [Desulfovibrionaceae bacterium]